MSTLNIHTLTTRKHPNYSLSQIAQTRLPLESLSLELARDRVSTHDIDELKGLKEDLLRDFRRDGIRGGARADLAFHSCIWELSDNPWLYAALRRICAPYFAYVSVFQLGRTDHSEQLMEHMHQRYIEFLSRTSKEPAHECVAFHLELGKATKT